MPVRRSIRCDACGLINPAEVNACRRCGAAVILPEDLDATAIRYAAPRKPVDGRAVQQGVLALLLALVIPAAATYYDSRESERSARCTSTAAGTLDDRYTVVTTYVVPRRLPVPLPVSHSYRVTYTFPAGGRVIHATATLDHEPDRADVSVRFDPNDPGTSELEAYKTGLAVLCAQYSWLPLVLFGGASLAGAVPGRGGSSRVSAFTLPRPVRVAFAVVVGVAGVSLFVLAYQNVQRGGDTQADDAPASARSIAPDKARSAPVDNHLGYALAEGCVGAILLVTAHGLARRPVA